MAVEGEAEARVGRGLLQLLVVGNVVRLQQLVRERLRELGAGAVDGTRVARRRLHHAVGVGRWPVIRRTVQVDEGAGDGGAEPGDDVIADIVDVSREGIAVVEEVAVADRDAARDLGGDAVAAVRDGDEQGQRHGEGPAAEPSRRTSATPWNPGADCRRRTAWMQPR